MYNLVARSTLADRWERHFLDSAQLYGLLPEGCKTLIDLGSGAGFPGLVLAAMGVESGLSVKLIESTGKKATFLREAAGAMKLHNVEVCQVRIESLTLKTKPDAITARALAPLDKLCAMTKPLIGPSSVCLFLKGARASEELTKAKEHWHMSVKEHSSMTSNEAVILEIADLVPANF